MRAATVQEERSDKAARISIHAAHEGCDIAQEVTQVYNIKFQSTQPMRAATRQATFYNAKAVISIHAAHEGCDGAARQGRRQRRDFNPRSP